MKEYIKSALMISIHTHSGLTETAQNQTLPPSHISLSVFTLKDVHVTYLYPVTGASKPGFINVN